MELVAAVADQTDLPKARAADIIEAVFATIGQALKASEEVRLVGFGTFSTTSRAEAAGRNPRTGAPITIPAATSVRFKAGKGLRDQLN
jgi:DNA-binding protein HU-beta